MRSLTKFAVVYGAILFSAWAPSALADGDSTSSAAIPGKSNDQGSNVADAQNNRMQSLLGSSSSWSGHLNIYYNGPSLANPLSSDAPNPLNTIPVPEVNIQGTVSMRYRWDANTTVSLGAGVELFTPFTNPTGLSMSDPYINFNRLFRLGPIMNYAQLGPILWTDNQTFNDGYRFGLQFTNETYYVFKAFTFGMDLWAGQNFFASGNYDLSQQNAWFFGGGPYTEFALSGKVSLRSVLGVQADHSNDPNQAALLSWEHPYQTLGVGVQISKPWYSYLYVVASPYSGNFTSQNTGFGVNTIINLL